MTAQPIASISVEIATVETPSQPIDIVIVQVATGDGVTGSAYVWTLRRETPGAPAASDLIEAGVRFLAPTVVGRGLFEHEALFADVYRRTVALQIAGGPLAMAHSCIDMAIWDAACKSLALPLHRALGAYRDECPVYCTMFPRGHTAEEMIAEATRLAGLGFGSIKPSTVLDPADPEPGLDALRDLREALPPEVGLRVDGAAWWLLGTAREEEIVRLCHRLDELGLDWIEDPLPPHRIEALGRLREQLRTPLATGENVFDHQAFKAMLEREILDVAIIDPMRVGGITGTLKLARAAEAHGIPVALHAYGELAAQMVPALPNGLTVEHLPEVVEELLDEPLRPFDGKVAPSGQSGIGIRFNPDALRRR